ncbi:MAG: hypothetical protein LQ338_001464 [Usnochroma carphineum]|nr:MAG: hypothetical protein LQ338_001464 [Usnochroma carphineum]
MVNPSQQSQASSTESTASREHGRGPTSYDDSPAGSHSQSLRESTPSTSLSNQSSQQRTGSISPVHVNSIGESRRLHARLSNSPPFTVQRLASQHTSIENGSPHKSPATKRTASGQVKPAGNGHWTSLNGVNQAGHSRNSSTASKASQISDLSHELRTRLSYAMFKVQHGWQSHNLNELEAMTLPRTSPSTGVPQLQQAAASTTLRDKHSPCPQGPPPGSPMAYGHPQPQLISAPSPSLHQPGVTDEVFWKKHASKSVPKGSPTQQSPQSGPSLAPPVDILPRNSRQPHPARMLPPRLSISSLRNNSVSNLSPISGLSAGPNTPPRRRAPAIRTPSQNADAEKDAVETLMFMSSPGNSGYRPTTFPAGATSPQQTNNHLTMSPTKRVGFASGRNAISSPNPSGAPPRLTTTADIDRVLDEMPDRYSSSDDE